MAPQPQIVTQDIEQLTRKAEFSPSSLNQEARTVDVVWTTGQRVRRYGLFGPGFYEELSLKPKHVRMDALNDKAPLLDTHSRSSNLDVIGRVERARLEKGRGVATVRFPTEGVSERADTIFRLIADGMLSKISVGYAIHRAEQVGTVDEDGEAIPIYRAVDWEPKELSVVPIPADAGASVRSAAAETNPCVFVDATRGEDMKSKTAADVTSTPEPNPADAVDAAKERAEGVKAERVRAAAIRRIGDQLKLKPEFVEEHIERGSPVDEFYPAAVNARSDAEEVPNPGPGHIEAVRGGDAREKWHRGAEHWLTVRSGVDHIVTAAAEKRGETLKLDPGEFRGLSLLDLAKEALELEGVKTRGMTKTQVFAKALTQRLTNPLSGGLTKRLTGADGTGHFPVLLENLMHKTLLSSYETIESTWQEFCKSGNVSDFRPHHRYRRGAFGRLRKVNEHGEFKNKAIPDGTKESISADTFGDIIAITRQALINDDLGAMTNLAVELGETAGLSIELEVYDLLAENANLGPAMNDTNTLFHASHGNIGTGGAISVASIEADRVKMAKQQDPNGKRYLKMRPSVLLVPVGLGGQARIINGHQYDVDTIDDSLKPNVVVGLFKKVVDTPHLDGTRRYMFADPNRHPCIEVVFLDGQRVPYLEAQDGWRTDGIEMKVRHDYGVGAVDFRSALTNAGA